MKNRKADIRFSSGGRGQPKRGRLTPGERDGNFRCAHCGQQVVFDPLISGVKNRNHCPHCLWSRHVDLNRPGDRLAECKGGMRPIGLTLKRSRNKYARERDGEVMLIHQCAECGKLSINRIAADDNEALILQTLDESAGLDPSLLAEIEESDIEPLTPADKEFVRTALFGSASE
jgi:DNA-directed RNA polymerase subunit RPC12/RpoP